MQKSELQDLREHFARHSAVEINGLLAAANELGTEGASGQEAVARAAGMLKSLMETYTALAESRLRVVENGAAVQRRHFTRKQSREYRKAFLDHVTAKHAYNCAAYIRNTYGVGFTAAQAFDEAMAHTLPREGYQTTLQRHWVDFRGTHPEGSLEDWQANMAELRDASRSAMQRLRAARRKEAGERQRKHLQKLLAQQPRKAHRIIFGQAGGEQLDAARDKEDPTIVRIDNKGILESIHDYFASVFSPTFGCTGAEPDSAPPPWEVPDPDIPETLRLLTSHSDTRPQDRPDLWKQIMDRGNYDYCVRHLANNKAPGPDGIPNELLRWLPEDVHTAIHGLLAQMYRTAYIPQEWCESVTVLLHKKGDPLDPSNYRPIGLCNTIYNLYSALLTKVLQDFAQQHDIFTASQEGFRPYRNTVRQAHNLVSVYEDAALHKSNVTAMYVDFSMAFNTVDHGRLLQTMDLLGFPPQAARVVASLYSSAATSIKIPAGQTPPIPVQRGTVQGDTLSPLLFLIFIEPLLRWLQTGGRGYTIKAVGDSHEASKMKYAALAYADDLVLITENVGDMRVQARKLEKFLAWAGLSVNHTKCAITGATHEWAAGSGLHAAHPKALAHTAHTHETAVTVSGGTIPYLPPTQTYKYLGFDLNPFLDWNTMYDRVFADLDEKGVRLTCSLASPAQKLQVLRRCIIPAVTYHFPLAPYTARQIENLDKKIIQIAKRCMRLPKGMANAILHEDRHLGGLGVTSLLEDYVHLNTQCYVTLKNDQGRLGLVKRALEVKQRARTGNLPMGKVQGCRVLKYSTALRQLHCIERHGRLEVSSGGLNEGKTGNGLSAVLEKIKVDYMDLGIPAPVGHELLEPLWELGIQNTAQLLQPCLPGLNREAVVISTDTLAGTYGKRVQDTHKRALNALTLLLNSQTTVSEDHTGYRSTRALPLEQRVVRHPAVAPDLDPPEAPLRRHVRRQGAPGTRQTDTASPSPAPNPARTRVDQGAQQQPHDPPAGAAQQQGGRRSARLQARAATVTALNTPTTATARTTWKENKPRRPKQPKAPVNRLRVVTGTTEDGKPEDSGAPPRPADPHACAERTADKEFVYGRLAPKAGASRRRPGRGRQTRRTAQMDDQAILAMYEDTERVVAVIDKTMYHYLGEAQLKYKVQWAPTTILKEHLPAFRSLGYNARHTEPARTPWGPRASRLYTRVTWEDTWEPASALKGTDAWRMVERFERNIVEEGERSAATRKPCADEGLSHSDRQGVGMDPTPATNEFNPNYNSDLVEVCLTACDPGRDILPTGRYHVQALGGGDIYGVFDPLGRLVGTITAARAQWLYKRYEGTKQGKPALFNSLETGSFEEELAKLLLRYRDGHRDGEGRETRLSNHWAIPDPLMTALRVGLGVQGERFASPLNCNERTEVYWTMYPEDRVFGAQHDAYSTAWVGASEANPEYTAHELEKAMRWAIGSTLLASAPALTVMVMPHWRDSAYEQWLNHPAVRRVATIPAAQFQFKTCDHWRGKKEFVGNPKWDVNVLLVANEAGLKEWVNPGALYRELNKLPWLTRPIPTTDLAGAGPDRSAGPAADYKLPKRLREVAKKGNHEQGGRLNLVPGAAYTLAPASPRRYSDNVYYTDGSRHPGPDGEGSVCGSGIHNPALEVDLSLDPGGVGESNTITRAELAAIHRALHTADEDKDIYVASDSLCSLHIINNALRRPHCLRDHLHREIALEIAEMIMRRSRNGVRTHLLKVKAHAGVAGNEAADALANKAVQLKLANRFLESVEVGALARSGQWWPRHQHTLNDGRVQWRSVSNLGAALKGWLHNIYTCRTGYSNTDSVYARALADIAGDCCPVVNARMQHPSGKLAAAWRTALTFRAGMMWSAKLAQRYRTPGHAHDGACPLCGMPDGGTHIALECPAHKGHIMNRHDRAVAIIAKAVRRGKKGNNLLIADLGGKVGASLPFAACRRTPTWLLRDHPARPDLMLIDGIDHNHGLLRLDCRGLPENRISAIHVIEVGWCVDTQWQRKWDAKLRQHESNRLVPDLVRRLGGRYGLEQARGMVHVHPIPLGVTGLALQRNLTTLRTIGLECDQATRCLSKLSKLALTSLHDIKGHRQQLTMKKPG
jgi:ribonuclease HI